MTHHREALTKWLHVVLPANTARWSTCKTTRTSVVSEQGAQAVAHLSTLLRLPPEIWWRDHAAHAACNRATSQEKPQSVIPHHPRNTSTATHMRSTTAPTRYTSIKRCISRHAWMATFPRTKLAGRQPPDLATCYQMPGACHAACNPWQLAPYPWPLDSSQKAVIHGPWPLAPGPGPFVLNSRPLTPAL